MRRAALLCCCALLQACTTPGPSARVEIPPGRYQDAFDAARTALRSMRFSLDRVDAREGVISTQPRPTAGLATPWDPDQTSPSQELLDLIHDHRRTVVVRFEPAGPAPPAGLEIGTQAAPAQAPRNLLQAPGPLAADVSVYVYRLRRSALRFDADSVFLTRSSADISPGAPPGRFYEPVGRDPALASHIARRIAEALADTPADAQRPDAAEPDD